MSIDVEQLLTEVDSENPSGDDLEYDPEFGELERLAQGKPERAIGDTIVPAEDPDWKALKQSALKLFDRTRDIRVAMPLLESLAHTEGMTGLKQGLQVVHGLLTRFWDTVHPELDAEDDNDPTLRVNSMAALGDNGGMIRAVRFAPLVSHRVFGRFCLRDIQVVKGEVALPAEEDPPDSASLEAAFVEADLDELQAADAAIAESIDLSQQIEDFVTDQVGAAQALSFQAFREVLKEARHEIGERLARRGVAGAGEDASEEDQSAPGGGGAPKQKITGEITSREDVIRMIDKACAYFARNEPTSPVPLLLQRAKRLIGLNFLDIIREMAPDGLPQAQNVAGVTDE